MYYYYCHRQRGRHARGRRMWRSLRATAGLSVPPGRRRGRARTGTAATTRPSRRRTEVGCREGRTGRRAVTRRTSVAGGCARFRSARWIAAGQKSAAGTAAQVGAPAPGCRLAGRTSAAGGCARGRRRASGQRAGPPRRGAGERHSRLVWFLMLNVIYVG